MYLLERRGTLTPLAQIYHLLPASELRLKPPNPIANAAAEVVPLQIVSYCSYFCRAGNGCPETLENAAPIARNRMAKMDLRVIGFFPAALAVVVFGLCE
jgi:hypothetical protein